MKPRQFIVIANAGLKTHVWNGKEWEPLVTEVPNEAAVLTGVEARALRAEARKHDLNGYTRYHLIEMK